MIIIGAFWTQELEDFVKQLSSPDVGKDAVIMVLLSRVKELEV